MKKKLKKKCNELKKTYEVMDGYRIFKIELI